MDIDTIKTNLHLFEKLYNQILKYDDRSTVLCVASFAEDILEKTIKLFLTDNELTKKLFEPNGAFSSLSNKILSSYSLGLITQEQYNSLEAIRKIRNKFAHNWQLNSINEFQDLVNKITDINFSNPIAYSDTVLGKFKKNAPFVLVEIIANHLIIHSKKLHCISRNTIYK